MRSTCLNINHLANITVDTLLLERLRTYWRKQMRRLGNTINKIERSGGSLDIFHYATEHILAIIYIFIVVQKKLHKYTCVFFCLYVIVSVLMCVHVFVFFVYLYVHVSMCYLYLCSFVSVCLSKYYFFDVVVFVFLYDHGSLC